MRLKTTVAMTAKVYSGVFGMKSPMDRDGNALLYHLVNYRTVKDFTPD